MSKLLALTFLTIFTCVSLSAQRCGTDEFVASLKNDTKYQSYLKDLEAIKKIAPEHRSMVCAETIIIPVAVHFNDPITCEDPVCLLEAVEAQLVVMNEDFLAANADYSYYTDINAACPTAYPLATAPIQGEGSCIQFCLATQNHPASSALVDGDPAITVGQYEWASDAPEWAGYLNIFVDGSEGGLGVAWLPGSGDGDGFWVTPSAFGGPGFTCTSGGTLNNNGTYNLGRTATHEAGHYLGLPHVFGSCNSDPDSNPPGPLAINDTPPQGSSFFGCPTINSCADVPEDCGTNPQSIFSFMDYTDDACMVIFTADQSAVLNWHANNIPFTDDATLCGGAYGDISCAVPPSACENGVQDKDEQDVDCGGVDCVACPSVCDLPYFDEGGPTGAYANNSIQTWTFCPDTPTEILTVTFSAFDVEPNGANACYDFLEVYDGSSTTAPQIGGQFCGTTLADAPGAGEVSSSVPGGCLTFYFDSDGSVTPDGWEAAISCAEAGIPDLSPITTVLPSTSNGITNNVWTIKIQENGGAPTNGQITIIMPKDPRLVFSYDQTLTDVMGLPVENSAWVYDGSNSGFHIWNRDTAIAANASSTFGFAATYDPEGTSGSTPYTATVAASSGGEVNGTNNIDVETLNYFSN